jgi:DNA recombination protein RmuC
MFGLILLIIVLQIYQTFSNRIEKRLESKITNVLNQEINEIQNTMIKELSELRTKMNVDILEFKSSLGNTINEGLRNNIKDLQRFKEEINKEITNDFDKMNSRLEFQMERINRKVEIRLEEGFEKTSKTFTNIVERLTKIDEAQKNIDKLSTEIVSLQNLLSDKQTRGTYGEVQLNHILSSIFGESNNKIYETQVSLSNGKIVDALVHLPNEMGDLSIDSKFPLENYQKMIDKSVSDRDRELAKRAFKYDMKNHIDSISRKYIIPNETSDQAVLFVPAEAIFAEINAYHLDTVDYANNKRVWIASPTTLMSLLTTVQVLIRNVERDKYAKIIQEELLNLGNEFNRYQERWDKLNKQMETVTKSVKEVHTTSKKIGKRFNEISQVNLDDKKLDSK